MPRKMGSSDEVSGTQAEIELLKKKKKKKLVRCAKIRSTMVKTQVIFQVIGASVFRQAVHEYRSGVSNRQVP